MQAEKDLPSLLTSLFAFATSSKFNHVLASCTLATIRRLADLRTDGSVCSQWHDMRVNMHSRHWRVVTAHLADPTALPFDSRALFIILFYLIGEEGVEDLVHQLGSGCFRRSFTVLLYLCRVTNGLSSSRPPANRIESVFTGGQMHLSWHKDLMRDLME